MQSFQFKILNRILNNNENLHKWKIKETNKCYVCGEINGVKHRYFIERKILYLWKRLQDWMIIKYNNFNSWVHAIYFYFLCYTFSSFAVFILFLIIIGKVLEINKDNLGNNKPKLLTFRNIAYFKCFHTFSLTYRKPFDDKGSSFLYI